MPEELIWTSQRDEKHNLRRHSMDLNDEQTYYGLKLEWLI